MQECARTLSLCSIKHLFMSFFFKITNIFHVLVHLKLVLWSVLLWCRPICHLGKGSLPVKTFKASLAPVGEFLGSVSNTLTKLFIERREHNTICFVHTYSTHIVWSKWSGVHYFILLSRGWMSISTALWVSVLGPLLHALLPILSINYSANLLVKKAFLCIFSSFLDDLSYSPYPTKCKFSATS